MKYKSVLFIEDNKTKSEEIKKYLINELKFENVITKESFVSGLREIFTNDYDLLLLDMSLPVRDDNNIINDFLQLGGHKVLSEMKRKRKVIPTIVVTMYSEFNNGNSLLDLDNISKIIEKDFKEFYLGYVYFSSQNIIWQSDLKKIIFPEK
ncbi:response regulator [Elizabethkingia miricola]|uniref:Response regulator n=1 Tax=Elizabethkingia miricola TaxID=172045 RepID=A0ABD5B1Z5_ELIMR|nr:response regulator [Elizabethkingia miricola]MDQ8747735.1 response regulator [Elizabethkingia miricola]